MSDKDLAKILRLLEAIAEHHGICVHEWDRMISLHTIYDYCLKCGKRRDPVD